MVSLLGCHKTMEVGHFFLHVHKGRNQPSPLTAHNAKIPLGVGLSPTTVPKLSTGNDVGGTKEIYM